jgi:hypothetical protein
MKIKKMLVKKMDSWVNDAMNDKKGIRNGVCPWPHLIYEPQKPKHTHVQKKSND